MSVRVGGEVTFGALCANTGATGVWEGPGLYRIDGKAIKKVG